MRDFSYKMQQMRDFSCKNQEGSLDDKKKMQKNKCQFNFAPKKLSVLNDVVNHHEPAIGDVSHSTEPIMLKLGMIYRWAYRSLSLPSGYI